MAEPDELFAIMRKNFWHAAIQ